MSGHGTSVAAIAAGNGRGSVGGIYAGVAPESELLIVKLGNPRREGFPRTTELMQGVDYVLRKALEYRMPVAINISFGNTYGSHELIIKGKHKKTLIFPVFSGNSVFYSDSCLVVV